MLMDVFKKSMMAHFFYKTGFGELDVSFKNRAGKTYKVYKNGDIIDASYTLGNLMSNFATTSSSSYGVLFGDGNTEPTKDDYMLSGQFITGLTPTASVTGETDIDGGSVTAVYTITNDNATDVTIREVGLIGRIQYALNGSAYTLVERTVLDTPVTIPAGGVGQVTYTIRFNYPTA